MPWQNLPSSGMEWSLSVLYTEFFTFS
jgi:hypothetical protein